MGGGERECVCVVVVWVGSCGGPVLVHMLQEAVRLRVPCCKLRLGKHLALSPIPRPPTPPEFLYSNLNDPTPPPSPGGGDGAGPYRPPKLTHIFSPLNDPTPLNPPRWWRRCWASSPTAWTPGAPGSTTTTSACSTASSDPQRHLLMLGGRGSPLSARGRHVLATSPSLEEGACHRCPRTPGQPAGQPADGRG